MSIDEKAKTLHAADWAIIAIYFILCIAVGLWVSKRLCNACCTLAEACFRFHTNSASVDYANVSLFQCTHVCVLVLVHSKLRVYTSKEKDTTKQSKEHANVSAKTRICTFLAGFRQTCVANLPQA